MDVITGNWCRRHWAVPAMSKPRVRRGWAPRNPPKVKDNGRA